MAITLAATAGSVSAQVVFNGSGSSTVIQPAVDGFRAALGSLNPNVAGSFGSGRREINWDGVPDGFSAPNGLPANFFNVNSPRGVVFSTAGTGFQVSANAASGTPVNFGNIDASYATSFTTFSPQRLFTAIGSNILDVSFFVPGSLTPALSRGFGAVFTDVDLLATTGMQFFDELGNPFGPFFEATPGPPTTAGPLLSFLGVVYPTPVISRVRITSGNVALAAGASDQNGNARDAVAMDDFIYGEPIAGEPIAVVPEPSTVLLMAAGLALLVGARTARRRT